MTNRMRKKMEALILLLVLFPYLGMVALSYADDAAVLPKGVGSVSVEGQFYFQIDKKFDRDGHAVDAAIDYNTDMNTLIFPGLGFLEVPPPDGFGMPPGTASLGQSVVSFKYDVTNLNLLLAYGLTDKLTVGVFIPYQWVTNHVSAQLNTTNATVAKNPFIGTPNDPFKGAPFVPIAVLSQNGFSPQQIDQLKLTTEDVQQLLGSGLDVGPVHIPGFGYNRFETWSDSGIGDIQTGLKYQYLKNDNWRLALTGGVQFPSGKMADIDSLQGRAFGTGNWALLFRLHNDYIGIKDLVLNATLRYDLYLSAHKTLRIPASVHEPITDVIENVDRKPGNVFEAETSAKYNLAKGFDVSALYKYGFAQQDTVTGGQGHIQSLEGETDYTEHVYIVGLSYSTLPLFLEKKFPLPLTAAVAYRNRFAGTNNVFKSQFISASLTIFF